MSHKNCTFCNLPIILNPSAFERAKKYGGNPSDYTALFTVHSKCQVYVRDKADKTVNRRYYESLMGGPLLSETEFRVNAASVKEASQ